MTNNLYLLFFLNCWCSNLTNEIHDHCKGLKQYLKSHYDSEMMSFLFFNTFISSHLLIISREHIIPEENFWENGRSLSYKNLLTLLYWPRNRQWKDVNWLWKKIWKVVNALHILKTKYCTEILWHSQKKRFLNAIGNFYLWHS